MSEQEFTKHYNDFSDAIFRYCFFKTSNREVAQDLMQDTFMKAWKNIGGGTVVESMKPFLYKIATNLIIDFRRKKKTESLDSMRESHGFDMATDEHKKTPEIIDGQMVMEKIKDLPEQYRDVLLMRYAEDMSVKEIANVLGERDNTVSVRLKRGMDKLKEIYPS